jgi:hypothetical protein
MEKARQSVCHKFSFGFRSPVSGLFLRKDSTGKRAAWVADRCHCSRPAFELHRQIAEPPAGPPPDDRRNPPRRSLGGARFLEKHRAPGRKAPPVGLLARQARRRQIGPSHLTRHRWEYGSTSRTPKANEHVLVGDAHEFALHPARRPDGGARVNNKKPKKSKRRRDPYLDFGGCGF